LELTLPIYLPKNVTSHSKYLTYRRFELARRLRRNNMSDKVFCVDPLYMQPEIYRLKLYRDRGGSMLFETKVNYYQKHGITSLKTKFFTVAAAEPQYTTVLNLLQLLK